MSYVNGCSILLKKSIFTNKFWVIRKKLLFKHLNIISMLLSSIKKGQCFLTAKSSSKPQWNFFFTLLRSVKLFFLLESGPTVFIATRTYYTFFIRKNNRCSIHCPCRAVCSKQLIHYQCVFLTILEDALFS